MTTDHSSLHALLVTSWLILTACVGDIEVGPQASASQQPRVDEPKGELLLGSFQLATSCKGCHPTHYEEWEGSSHAHAMDDPVYMALIARQRTQRGHGHDLFCTQCHSALGTRSGDIQEGFALSSLSPITREGVTCEGCHRVTKLDRDFNSGHVIDAKAPLQGPYSDPQSPHPAVGSSLLVESRFCGGCHDVQDEGGLFLETPYREWLESPGRAAGKQCQTCHMPTYEGRASVLPQAPLRAEVHRHTFAGPDAPSALWLKGGERLARQRAAGQALLESGVALRAELRRAPDQALRAHVSLVSRTDAHDFPTGSTFFRQLWVHAVVRDAAGSAVFESGGLDLQGDLYDSQHPDGARVDPQLVTLGSTLLTHDGLQVAFPWQAEEVRRNALKPLEQRTVTYVVPLPADAQAPFRLDATLCFRSFAPRLLRTLDLDGLVDAQSLIEIVSARSEVR
jgi:hypothetical protein